MIKQSPIIKQLLVVLLLCSITPPAQAQQLATLNGAVTDQNAAVVAGVRIKLVNTETGET